MFKYIVIIIGLIFSTIATANEDWDPTKYEFRWMHVPVVCGTSEEVMRYLEDKGFRLESLSVGREGAKKDGDPAYCSGNLPLVSWRHRALEATHTFYKAP